MEMRQVFAAEMEKHMAANKNIVIIDADLSKACGTFPLRAKFPDRVFEVGVAEQNMASIAAGMSSYGFIPFIFSFTPFASRRIADQAAISCLYAKQNVKIVGTDPGIAAEYNGGTHMSMEDIGIMRAIPEMVVFEPVDAVQLAAALPSIIAYQGTMYIRMWRKKIEPVFKDGYKFDLFKADVIKKGKDVSVFTTGLMTQYAIKAADSFKAAGIDAEIINVHTIKPLDEKTILSSIKKTKAAVVCDNGNICGGLCEAIAGLAARNFPVPMEFVAVNDRFGQVGKLDFLAKEYGLRPEDIAAAAVKVVARKSNKK
jgi:transketolase